MLQCPDRTAFAPAALMLSCLGTAIDLLDIYLLDISRQLACMKLGRRENISLYSTAGPVA